MQVFLSYASENRDLADEVHLALVGAGHKVFFDKEDLPPGGDYNERIAAAVALSDAMVFLISQQSVAKGSYALTELKFARKKWPHPEGRVLPVLQSPVPFDAIPSYLKAVTVLKPEGNTAAEVRHAVTRMAEEMVLSTQTVPPGAHRLQWSRSTIPLVVGVLGALGAMAALILNWDKISKPTLPDWEAIGGDWTYKRGVVHGKSASFDGDALFLFKNTYSDFHFSALAQALSREASLALRMSNDGRNGYFVIFVPSGCKGGNPGLWLAKRVRGNHTFPGYFPADLKNPTQLTVEAHGPRIRVLVNGGLAIDFKDEDNPFHSGRLGFRCYGEQRAPCEAKFSELYLSH